MQCLCVAFINVTSVKFAYSAGIEERIYIGFTKTHLCVNGNVVTNRIDI